MTPLGKTRNQFASSKPEGDDSSGDGGAASYHTTRGRGVKRIGERAVRIGLLAQSSASGLAESQWAALFLLEVIANRHIEFAFRVGGWI